MDILHNAFETVYPFLFALLMACVVAGLVLTARLHRLLRDHHPDVYDALGRPTLFLNNSIQNSWAFSRFLIVGRFQQIEHPQTLRLCRFMRAFLLCYLVFFVVLLAFGLLAAPLHTSK